MNNFTNFLNHLNSFPKNKNQLNELNSSGRYYNPEDPDRLGPDRAPPSNPLALNYFPDRTGRANSVSGKPNMQKNEAHQEFLRALILSHKHVPFEELHKERFNGLPGKERELKVQQLGMAYNVATGDDANQDTLMLAATHNDPAIREAAYNNQNATDNIKGMALWHDTMMEHTENELRSQGIHPADLHRYSTHPQIRQINERIALNLKNLKSNLSVKINKGQNLLKLHEQYLRGEAPPRDDSHDTPDRMN